MSISVYFVCSLVVYVLHGEHEAGTAWRAPNKISTESELNLSVLVSVTNLRIYRER